MSVLACACFLHTTSNWNAPRACVGHPWPCRSASIALRAWAGALLTHPWTMRARSGESTPLTCLLCMANGPSRPVTEWHKGLGLDARVTRLWPIVRPKTPFDMTAVPSLEARIVNKLCQRLLLKCWLHPALFYLSLVRLPEHPLPIQWFSMCLLFLLVASYVLSLGSFSSNGGAARRQGDAIVQSFRCIHS